MTDERTLSPPAVAEAEPAPPADKTKRHQPLRRAAFLAFYVILAIVCFFTIKHELGPGGLQSVAASLRAIEGRHILASVTCTMGVFATLWVMEQAALNRIHAPRATHAKPISALVSNAVSLGSGFGIVSGGALRARLYASAGLDAAGAFYVASAVTLMSLLGGATIASFGLAFMSGETLQGPEWRGLGAAGLGGICILVALAGARGRTFTLFGRRINLPGAAELVFWIALGAFDWVLSAAALFMLLPDHDSMSFAEFTTIFATSHLVAMPTGAPGGLGVFDALMLSAAGGAAPPGQLAAALIVHRALAFLAPVCLGLIGIAALEARHGGRSPQRTATRQESSGRLMHALLQLAIGARWRSGAAPVVKGALFADTTPATTLHALTGQGPILVLAPHPDDDVLGCGGLISAATAAGVEVHIAYLTDGRRSHVGSRHWSAARLIEARRAEARNAAQLLGVEPWRLTFLPNRDGTLLLNANAQRKTARILDELVRRHGIRRIFTSWLHDPHPDHVAAALLAQGMHERRPQLTIISYPVYGRLLPDRTVLHDRNWRAVRLDVREQLDAKRAALGAHRTQITPLIDDALVVFPAPNHGQRAFFTDYETFLE